MTTNTEINKDELIAEFHRELENILRYWSENTVDTAKGGFYGRINEDNEVVEGAPKGSVLNARILWTFSAAFNFSKNDAHLAVAGRCFDYFCTYFLDVTFGGVYWTVDADGNPHDTKKQVYALAFAIYGLAEYHRASGDRKALNIAKRLFSDIEEHSFDETAGGYFEAFTREWVAIADLRLSEKDANEKKTMNTHLHILEAYTNLYRVWQDDRLKEKIRLLIGNFTDHFVNAEGHLELFFDEHWNRRSSLVSYGHDIEASWLLLEAAEVIAEEELIAAVKTLSLKMASASEKGLEPDGAMIYEYDPATGHTIREKHWWVQAEAMVGFLQAGILSGEIRFYHNFIYVWRFIQESVIDPEHGEWYWGISGGGPMKGEDKAGLWKCPYHNTRACMEVIKRLTIPENR